MGNPIGGRITISVTKSLAAATAYDAKDVLSESASAGASWTFSAIARENGSGGYITKAHVISETTALAPRLTLFLFNAVPTSALNDHAANTAPIAADLAKYIGRINFPAMESSNLGTGMSDSLATPSTYGNLPLAFQCAAGVDDLYGILVTWDAFTQVATKNMTIRLTVDQF